MPVLAQAVAPVSVIASAAKQSRNASAEAVWIASARAKALADKVAELAMTSLGQERSALSLSSPAKAGDPVRRDGRDWIDRPRRTGFPAFAGN